MKGVLLLRDPEDVEVILHADHTVGESTPRIILQDLLPVCYPPRKKKTKCIAALDAVLT